MSAQADTTERFFTLLPIMVLTEAREAFLFSKKEAANNSRPHYSLTFPPT